LQPVFCGLPGRARPVTQAGSGETEGGVFPTATADPGTKAAPTNGKPNAGFAQIQSEQSQIQRFTIDKTHKISIGSPGIPTASTFFHTRHPEGWGWTNTVQPQTDADKDTCHQPLQTGQVGNPYKKSTKIWKFS
jgi:hypothetical protein